MAMEIRRYNSGDYWGVYEGGELLCVTVYKKGAKAVVKRISEDPKPYQEREGRMFPTVDLPLFSGTPLQARAAASDPQPVEWQARMGACPLCFDTGRTKVSGDGYCLCPIGEAARQEKSRKERTQ